MVKLGKYKIKIQMQYWLMKSDPYDVWSIEQKKGWVIILII